MSSEILSHLAAPAGARHLEKRFGRGVGSGIGKTCGRGQKGQKARQGGNIGKLHFQGGQTPIQRRLPKRGFRRPFPIDVIPVNLGDLQEVAAGTNVDEAFLRDARLVQGTRKLIKVLGDGEFTKKLTIHAHSFSKSALEKIEAAGGKAVVVPVVKQKEASAG
ncbi:MAG: 50S ribosomal protein L15 [Myxococcales bacterium]|jgi:large subunit ribosomal protein L15